MTKQIFRDAVKFWVELAQEVTAFLVVMFLAAEAFIAAFIVAIWGFTPASFWRGGHLSAEHMHLCRLAVVPLIVIGVLLSLPLPGLKQLERKKDDEMYSTLLQRSFSETS